MKYLPILQELFESDTLWFFLIGAAISAVFMLRRLNRKSSGRGIIVSAAVYALCELIANAPGSYAVEFIALIVGSAALGALAVSLVLLIFCFIKKRRET